MDNYDVVKRLVGEIDPVGDSTIDKSRFENLEEMCSLVDKLITDIANVTVYKGRVEHSMNKAGEYADEFLSDNLGIEN